MIIKDKVILVTGAFGLIGKQVSKAYLKNGAKVILAGHNKGKIEKIKTEFAKDFNLENFFVTNLELTDSDDIKRCLKESVDRFSKIDVLVNNAAIDAKFDKKNLTSVNMSRFENYPIELVKRSMEVNVIGTIEMTQEMCKQMLKQGFGNIINVASIYSLISPTQELYDFGGEKINYKPVDYVASKSFIPNFTRYISTFYGKENIRCNAIAPHGIFDNHDEPFLKNFEKLSPVGRMCKIGEMDGPFIFLASDSSSYVNGITLTVDGAWSAR